VEEGLTVAARDLDLGLREAVGAAFGPKLTLASETQKVENPRPLALVLPPRRPSEGHPEKTAPGYPIPPFIGWLGARLRPGPIAFCQAPRGVAALAAGLGFR
jgi:hypothetical protein